MKKLIIIIGLITVLSLTSAHAQDTTNAPSTSWWQNLGHDLAGVTNWSIYPYGTYAPDAPKKFGGGVLAIYNVNGGVGLGLGVDELGGTFQMVSGNIELKVPTHPLGFIGLPNVAVIPFGLVGIGTPMGGAGAANGNVSVIAGAGMALDLFAIKGFQTSIGYEYSNWSGVDKFSGTHHHLFLGVRKSF